MTFAKKNPNEQAMYTNNFIQENLIFCSVFTIEIKHTLTKNPRNDDVLVIVLGVGSRDFYLKTL